MTVFDILPEPPRIFYNCSLTVHDFADVSFKVKTEVGKKPDAFQKTLNGKLSNTTNYSFRGGGLFAFCVREI